MLNSDVIASVDRHRTFFQSAKPFKHVCIDNFLDATIAQQLLVDFPKFDRSYAKNEFGDIGGKAVRTAIREISPTYERFADFLSSNDFLQTISHLTGIDDLVFDPQMYGGGTHENQHGQDLDPHVDFNYDESETLHRRLNLILYLNKEWNRAWGGSIELHSNPRRPAENKITEYEPLFNRAVIFETNEHSWHGFERITLPVERRGESRKSISIYLYTRERPSDEIAPRHGTFYVPRPLPARFQVGYELRAADVSALNEMLLRRDAWIEFYQGQELALNRVIGERTRYLKALLASVRIPVTGYVIQEPNSARDIYADGWVGPNAEVRLRSMEPVSRIEVRGLLPDQFPVGGRLIVELDGKEIGETIMHSGEFAITVVPKVPITAVFSLRFLCTKFYNGVRAGESQDARDLAFMLLELKALHD